MGWVPDLCYLFNTIAVPSLITAFPAPINVVNHMQAELYHGFRCYCFNRRSLKAGAFLVLPRVRSQVYVLV
jgi:cytochrome c oxidase assembly protein Cox11